MNIDVTKILKTYDGQDLTEQGLKKDANGNQVPIQVPVTLRAVLNHALDALPRDPDPQNPGQLRHLTTEEKERRFQLSQKLWGSKIIHLDHQEAADLIQLANNCYDSPLVCGRVKQLLEGEEQTVPEETAEDPAGEPQTGVEE